MARSSKIQRENNVKRGNADKIKGQGFHTNPERINKAGRPKKIPAIDVMLAEMFGVPDGAPLDNARIFKILEALAKKAQRGDKRAAEIILERIYGKMKQSIGLHQDGPSAPPIITGMIILPSDSNIDYSKLSDGAKKEIAAASGKTPE